MLSENFRVTNINGIVLTISQTTKFVMSSDAEVELAGLFICPKEMIPLRQNLMEMV